MHLNGAALAIAEPLCARPATVGAALHIVGGARVLDCGVAAAGGSEAGLGMARVALGGLGSVTLEPGGRPGAAPLPVPPPIPDVIKHRSAPAIMALMSSRLSSAANRPISGSPPAPKPRVTDEPMLSMDAPLALDRPSACASVLMAQNSTPPIRVSNIRSTYILII